VYLVDATDSQSATSLPERFNCGASNLFCSVAQCCLSAGEELCCIASRVLDYVH